MPGLLGVGCRGRPHPRLQHDDRRRNGDRDTRAGCIVGQSAGAAMSAGVDAVDAVDTARATDAPRVVIIGAGPAGVRAAVALVEAGIRPIVIDEGSRDGGQIYRRQPAGFTRPYQKLYGSEAAKAE